MPFPQHIKVDVDGLEHKIVAGAARTLQNPRVRSVMIEVNEELSSHRHLVELMTQWGFTATVNRHNKPGTTVMGSVHNYLFKRDIMNMSDSTGIS